MSDKSNNAKGIRRTVIGVLIVVTLILFAFINKLSSPRILTEQELQTYGAYELPVPRRFSDFELTDHRGEPFTQESLKGKWTLIFFGYTHCPDICPVTMSMLGKVYKGMKPEEQQELQVVLASLDHERDTPESMAQYVSYFHPDFIGATGDQYKMLKLATELNVAYAKMPRADGDYTIDHSGNVILINPYGHFHGYLRPPFEDGSLRVALRSIMASFEH